MVVSTSIPEPAIFAQRHEDTAAPTLLAQGAEALVYKTTFLTSGTPCALKYRPAKKWRHPILDRRLTKSRLLSEARTLTRCRKDGVRCPAVLGADWEAGWLALEWIEGMTIRKVLDKYLQNGEAINAIQQEAVSETRTTSGIWELMGKVGRIVGRLHEIGVVHGDLTTSNIMLRSSGSNDVRSADTQDYLQGDAVLIDFGLANQLVQDEDRAVDLYVLERAFGSTHPAAAPLFDEVLRVYGESYKGAKPVLKRLGDVRMRGRKRSMVG